MDLIAVCRLVVHAFVQMIQVIGVQVHKNTAIPANHDPTEIVFRLDIKIRLARGFLRNDRVVRQPTAAA